MFPTTLKVKGCRRGYSANALQQKVKKHFKSQNMQNYVEYGKYYHKKKQTQQKKQNKNNFGLKTKNKNKMMDVSPQTPKVL